MKKKNKIILVTGGTGFVGSNLVRRLVNEGYVPVLFLRKEANISRIKDILGKIKIIETDLTDLKKLQKDVFRVKPQVVFHLAVYGAYQSRQSELTKTINTNIVGSANLLEACCQVGFEHFINTGSSSEYGDMTKPAIESDALNPTNLYGVTKSAVTLLVNMYAKQYKLPVSTLRLFSPYGYYEDASRFVPTLIIGSILNKTIKLTRPAFVRDFVFIDDIIDAYMCFAQKKYTSGNIFNIASGRQTRLSEVVKIIESISGKKLKVIWNSHSVHQVEPKIWQGNVGKAKKMLSWTPRTPLADGLNKSFSWFSHNIKFYL